MIRNKVSIILPIYNVEKYLNDCIKSVIEQTYENFELILIDDGSQDTCPTICEEWKKKDNRIKVIHKINNGLGMARNTGIDFATGEYICFFDSDDFFDNTLIEQCVDKMTRYSVDFVIYGFCDVTEEGKIIKNYIPTIKKNIYQDEEIKDFFIKQLYASNKYKNKNLNLKISAWNCMFSMKLIKQINFKFVSERKIISEDIYSMLVYYSAIKRVYIIPEKLYNHRVNSKSLTHVFRKDRFKKLNCFYKEILILCDKLSLDKEMKTLVANPYISGVISALKILVHSDENLKYKVAEYKKIINDEVFIMAVNSINLKYENKKRRILLFLLKHKFVFLSYFMFLISK